jgi:iron-sulfur cluster assembly protein
MLTLTPAAADAVRLLVTSMPVDEETGGLRIARAEAARDGTSFEMAIVDGPQASDEELESNGAYVFLARPARESLDGKTLHAEFEPGRVRFMVVEPPSPAD